MLRKLGGGTGLFADRLLAAWQEELDARAENDITVAATAALGLLVEATAWIRDQLENDEAKARGAATGYLRLFALTTMSVFWSRAVAALDGDESQFAQTKRKVAAFYASQVLPETASISASIRGGASSLAAFSAEDLQV